MKNIYYIAQSHNPKTGSIPQQYIGATLEESRKTCKGCALLADHSCYAQYGNAARTYHQVASAALINPEKYTIEKALKNRHKDARYVRMGTIGDASKIDKRLLLKHESFIRSLGLGVLNYTHFWKTSGRHLIKRAMASCNNWKEVKEALKLGWRATTIVTKEWVEKNGKKGLFQGKRWAICPYQTHQTTCNKCGLCDASKTYLLDVVVFIKH